MQRYCYLRTYAKNNVAKDSTFVALQHLLHIIQQTEASFCSRGDSLSSSEAHTDCISNGGGLGLEPGQVIRAVLDIKNPRGTHVRRGNKNIKYHEKNWGC